MSKKCLVVLSLVVARLLVWLIDFVFCNKFL
jgi:hypothetical protein